MLKAFTMTAAVALGLIAAAASAAPSATVKVRSNAPQHLLPRERITEVVRARHIRFAGDPYLYNGRYIMRCYDKLGRLAYCEIDPYSGAFIGISLRL